jgi:hypothetical protein
MGVATTATTKSTIETRAQDLRFLFGDDHDNDRDDNDDRDI